MCFHIGKRSVHDYKEFGANIWTNSKQAVSQVMHPAPRNHPSATCSLTANCETKPLHEAQSPVRGEAFVYGAAVENQPDGCHVSCSCSIKGFRADGADCRSGEVRREWDVLCECGWRWWYSSSVCSHGTGVSRGKYQQVIASKHTQ